MSLRTNKWTIAARDVGRKLGLNRLASTRCATSDYESAFRESMFACLRPADVVWDVGANIGHYSRQFSHIVGERGCVFAFEPSPRNRVELAKCARQLKNTHVVPLALGDHEGVVAFAQGSDELGATSRVVGFDEPSNCGVVDVPVTSADQAVDRSLVCLPHVIKLDVEGYEVEVLRGATRVLGARKLRAVCVEVHFGLLSARGLRNGPALVELFLEAAGFTLEWPDNSHIVATRE
jgi:FkbM family methyltransferase